MVAFSAQTHPGCVEQSNEDSVGWDTARGVWLVADGMGGHAKGEVASRVVKDTILDRVAHGMPLRESVLDAHRAVVEAAESSASMGSTVVAMKVGADSCDVVWVGDSRAYLWRKGKLRRVSRDHSLLEMLLANKQVSAAEARAHPKRHVVLQTLGMGEPAPGEASVDLRSRDWFLLCSDGLTDELTDDELAERLENSASPKEAADGLLAAALKKGARDNVSVLVLDCGPRAGVFHLRWLPIALGIVGALALVLVLRWLEVG
jgi:PPM family protein phosphatase